MPTHDIVAIAITAIVLIAVAWSLWRRCPARSEWNHRCDRKRGHGGMHYVDHAFDIYWFDDEGRSSYRRD